MSISLSKHYWKHGPSSPTDNIVLLALAEHADDKGLCWPSVSTLASRTRFAKRTVQYALRSLEAQRFITTKEWFRKGVQVSNRYQLHLSDEFDLWDSRVAAGGVQEVHPGGARRDTPGVQEVHPGGARRDTPLEPSFEPSLEPPVLSCTSLAHAYPPEAETKKRGNGIPATRTEAIDWATMENVPAEFAGEIFDDLEGVNWIDWHDRAVTNWRSHIRYRWSRSQKTKNTYANGNGKKSDGCVDRSQFTYAGRARRSGGGN